VHVLRTSILLQIPNVACPTTRRRVLGDYRYQTKLIVRSIHLIYSTTFYHKVMLLLSLRPPLLPTLKNDSIIILGSTKDFKTEKNCLLPCAEVINSFSIFTHVRPVACVRRRT